jgi:hypothetical protein
MQANAPDGWIQGAANTGINAVLGAHQNEMAGTRPAMTSRME